MPEPTRTPAANLPVARVQPLLALSHLDREFDYLVPENLDAHARPGVRVRVRFSGRVVDGYVITRTATSDHLGKLGWIDRVVSPEPVLTPAVLTLVDAVAARYAGTRSDVLRLAVPPRHARVEAESVAHGASAPGLPVDRDHWAHYERGTEFLDALVGGRGPRAVWQALPGEDWAMRLAEAAAACVAGGSGALVLVPDQRDLDRLERACITMMGTDSVATLSAGLGPAVRYRRWLSVLRGRARVVIGTRAAVFAPVHDLGLVAVWDDGDDSHAEQRVPYPHAREVALLRAHSIGCAALIGGVARTAESQVLVESGWAKSVVATRETVRARSPRIVAPGDSDHALARDPLAHSARLPAVAFAAARGALARSTAVLVQVPRRGYVPSLACARCRTPASCRRCHGRLALPAARTDDAATATCVLCGIPDPSFRCGRCGSRALRAVVVGAERTAEELGRAFPGVPVQVSGADAVIDEVAPRAALVVATPGAEPTVPGGYGAALLLDGWALLGRADLRADEEALRRWLGAAALVRPWGEGGEVVVVADPALPVVQALVRWDPAGHASSELLERRRVHFPPAVRLAAIDGSPESLTALMEAARLPESAEVLGPVDLPAGQRLPFDGPAQPSVVERLIVRAPRSDGAALARALAEARAVIGARRIPVHLRIRVDPVRIG